MPTAAVCRKPSTDMKVFGPRIHFLGEKKQRSWSWFQRIGLTVVELLVVALISLLCPYAAIR